MATHTKLATSDNCGELVDEYVETEASIIIIDMLLLKKAALRHVLFNSNLQGVWKLVILFILCDAYEKTSHSYFSEPTTKNGDYIIDVELNFYLMCLKSLLEYLVFATLVITVLYQSPMKDASKSSYKYFYHGIVLASYGKLFMLPLLIWSKNDDYCEILIVLFIFLSKIQVILVTTDKRFDTVAILVVASELGHLLIQNAV